MTYMGDNIFECRKVIPLLKSIANYHFYYFIKWNIRKLNTFLAKFTTKIYLGMPPFLFKHACILREHCCRNLYTQNSLKAKMFCNVCLKQSAQCNNQLSSYYKKELTIDNLEGGVSKWLVVTDHSTGVLVTSRHAAETCFGKSCRNNAKLWFHKNLLMF